MASPAPRQPGRRDELAQLLADIDRLRTRLQSPSALDTSVVDAELDGLVTRLRASEQKLKSRKRLDIPGERRPAQ